jgi:hypothetical protein
MFTTFIIVHARDKDTAATDGLSRSDDMLV